MFRVVSIGAITPLEWVIAVLFVITFSWITLSFTASIAGFVWLLAHRAPGKPPPRLRERTAVVIPIYNEAHSRVFGDMQAIFEDVEGAGQAHAFDFPSSPTPPTPISGSRRSARSWRCARGCRRRASTTAGGEGT